MQWGTCMQRVVIHLHPGGPFNVLSSIRASDRALY